MHWNCRYLHFVGCTVGNRTALFARSRSDLPLTAMHSPATLLHGQLPLFTAVTQLAVPTPAERCPLCTPKKKQCHKFFFLPCAAQGQHMTHKQERWLSLLQLLRLVSTAAALQEMCPILWPCRMCRAGNTLCSPLLKPAGRCLCAPPQERPAGHLDWHQAPGEIDRVCIAIIQAQALPPAAVAQHGTCTCKPALSSCIGAI